MNLRNILTAIFIFWHLPPAFADNQKDIEAFNAAYAEYTELVQSSTDLDATIAVAQKVNKLAPRIYGRYSEEYAITTFNLAELYDFKGGDSGDENEEKGLKLYRAHFKLVDRLKQPRDRTYFNKYWKLARAAHNVHGFKTSDRHEKKLLEIAEKIPLSGEELGDLNFEIAMLKIRSMQANEAWDFFSDARELYKLNLGSQHIKVADTSFWLGKMRTSWGEHNKAREYYQEALVTFEKIFEQPELMEKEQNIFMANLLETVGRSDDATKYVIEAAVEQAEGQQHIRPLYRAPMLMPENAPKKPKFQQVTLEFTIDKMGRPKDIIIDESTDEKFNDISVINLEKFRFTPTRENGDLVDKKNIKMALHYIPQLKNAFSWRDIPVSPPRVGINGGSYPARMIYFGSKPN